MYILILWNSDPNWYLSTSVLEDVSKTSVSHVDEFYLRGVVFRVESTLLSLAQDFFDLGLFDKDFGDTE